MITRTVFLIVLLSGAVHAAAGDLGVPSDSCEPLFGRRDDQGALLQAIDCYEKMLTDKPGDLEILARLSICYYWKAYNMPGDEHRDARQQDYKIGMDYAMRVLAAQPRHVAANFWYASNLARYGVEVGIMKSLFSIKEMNRHLRIVEEEDRFYFRGGPQRYRASLIVALPAPVRKSWGGGSLKDAETMLREAIDYEPNFAFSYLILADVYLAMGKQELARDQLEKIASIREQDLPEYAAEIRRNKIEAREMMQRLFPK
jgi:tetratricopeptide (TPR) repeat protein